MSRAVPRVKRSGSGYGHEVAVAADMRRRPAADKGRRARTQTSYSQHS